MDQQQYHSPEKQVSNHEYYDFGSYLNDDKIGEAEGQFKELVAKKDWKNLSQWGARTVQQNKRKIEEIQIGFGFDVSYYSEQIQSIKGVILSRLAYFVSKPLNLKYLEYIATAYHNGIGNLNLQPSCLKYFLPQLLNASRSLLYGSDSAQRSLIYTENMTVSYNLDTDKKIKVEQLLGYYRQLLQTKLFEESISIIKKIYKEKLQNLTKELAIKYLSNMQIEFVRGCKYSGMVSFQGIFIDADYLLSISYESVQAELIGIIFYEGMHLLLRKINNNIFELTPPNTINDEDNLEGGFLMEKVIFGGYKEQYWKQPEKILNIHFWDSSPPLFSKDECQKMSIFHLDNFQCSGICPIRRSRYK